jgi:hypothetical protein
MDRRRFFDLELAAFAALVSLFGCYLERSLLYIGVSVGVSNHWSIGSAINRLGVFVNRAEAAILTIPPEVFLAPILMGLFISFLFRKGSVKKFYIPLYVSHIASLIFAIHAWVAFRVAMGCFSPL